MFPPLEHSPLSPSRLQRIIDCPGSYKFGRQIEEERDEEPRSSYAEEGSMLHAAVESYITNTKWTGPELSPEQKVAVGDAIDYFHKLESATSDQEGYELLVEKRVYLKTLHSCLYDCSGTSDIIISTKDELHVLDWKFGQGIPVYADDNDQLYAYAAGALSGRTTEMPWPYKIFIHCIQPRLDSYDVHEMTPKELMQWVNGRLVPGVTEALSDSPNFNPGTKQCRWCPAKVKCRARFNHANKTAADVFKVVAKLPDNVTDSELADLYKRSKVLDKYLKDIGAHIKHTLESGQQFEGYKLVAGRSIRRWKHDPEVIMDAIDKDIGLESMFVSKFISPAQAEKLNRSLKKEKWFQELIEKPEGKPTLVEEGDKRPPLEFRSVGEIFKGV